MKLKLFLFGIFPIVASFVFAVTGCKPKEAVITGQIFIVTKGRQNIVLGDQKIAVLDTIKVRNYLNSKTMEWSNSLETAEAKIYKAYANIELATSNLNLAIVKPDAKQDPDIAKFTAAKKYHDNIMATMPSDTPEWQQAYEWSKKLEIKIADLDKIRKDSAEQKASDEELVEAHRKLDEANSLLEAAIAEQERLWEKINWPSPNDYEIPEIISTTTDSEGRFKFILSASYAGTDLELFAKADRLVGDEKEKYWWMEKIRLYGNDKTTEVILSNENKDPSGVWGQLSDEYDLTRNEVVLTRFQHYMILYKVRMDADKGTRKMEAFIKSLNSQ